MHKYKAVFTYQRGRKSTMPGLVSKLVWVTCPSEKKFSVYFTVSVVQFDAMLRLLLLKYRSKGLPDLYCTVLLSGLCTVISASIRLSAQRDGCKGARGQRMRFNSRQGSHKLVVCGYASAIRFGLPSKHYNKNKNKNKHNLPVTSTPDYVNKRPVTYKSRTFMTTKLTKTM